MRTNISFQYLCFNREVEYLKSTKLIDSGTNRKKIIEAQNSRCFKARVVLLATILVEHQNLHDIFTILWSPHAFSIRLEFFFERHYKDKTYSHYYFDKKSHTLTSNWKKDHHTLLTLTCHAVTSVLKQKDHHKLLTLTCHAVPSVLKLSMSSSIQFFSKGKFVKQ